MDMRRTVDRLLQSGYLEADGFDQPLWMPMNVTETPDAFEIEASLPGVKPDDIEITQNQNTLTIRGEIRDDEDKGDKTYHVRERRVGSFVRSITLPSMIKSDAIEAHCDDGVLRLRLPKADEAKPRRIRVQGGGKQSQMIEGNAKSSHGQQQQQKKG